MVGPLPTFGRQAGKGEVAGVGQSQGPGFPADQGGRGGPTFHRPTLLAPGRLTDHRQGRRPRHAGRGDCPPAVHSQLAPSAELVPLDRQPQRAQLFAEMGLPRPQRLEDLPAHLAILPPLLGRLVPLRQMLPHALGRFAVGPQVDTLLVAILPVSQFKIRPEPPSAAGPPRFHDRSLACEDLRLRVDQGEGLVGALCNGFHFFQGLFLRRGSGR